MNDKNRKYEAPLGRVYDLIFSENFGKPDSPKDFIENIKHLNPKQRVIAILEHYTQLEPKRRYYRLAERLISQQANKYWNSEDENKSLFDKPSYDPNNPITSLNYEQIIDGLFTKCTDFLYGYFDSGHCLANELGKALKSLYIKYSLHEYDYLIKNRHHVLLQDDELIEISPLLFPFELWKDLIVHDFSLSENLEKFNLIKNRVLSQIEELEYHVRLKKIPTGLDKHLIDDIKFPNTKITYNEYHIEFLNFSAQSLTVSISKYKDFIHSLEEKNNQVKLKIHKGNETSIIRGFTYLLKKSNPGLNNKTIDKIATQTIDSIFNNKIASDDLQQKKIILSNLVLVDFILFLAKNNYIKLHKNITLYPKLISKRLPFKMKGSGEKRLYQLFKGKLSSSIVTIKKDKEDYSNLVIDFNGLTSEKALLNEIRN